MQISLTLHSSLNLSFLPLNDLYKQNSVRVLISTFCFWLNTPNLSLSMKLIQIPQAQLAKATSCTNKCLLIHGETDPKHNSIPSDCIKNNSFFCHLLFYLNDFHTGVNPPSHSNVCNGMAAGPCCGRREQPEPARREQQEGAALPSPAAWIKAHGCVASAHKCLKSHCSHRPPYTL